MMHPANTGNNKMKFSNVNRTEDISYKGGFVKCACGWRKDLGDGFNGYHIDNCPSCSPQLFTRDQRKVITGSKTGRGIDVSIGGHTYFVLSNGIHVQFCESASLVAIGISERQADKM